MALCLLRMSDNTIRSCRKTPNKETLNRRREVLQECHTLFEYGVFRRNVCVRKSGD